MKKTNPKTCKTVRLVYGIVTSVYSVVLGVLAIWQLLDIYFSGRAQGLTSPYTYEAVAGKVSSVLAIPFYIWIAIIIVGFVLWEIFPVAQKRTALTDERYVLYRLKKRIPADVEGNLKKSLNFVKREEETLKIIWIICAVAVVVVGLTYVIAYMATPANFPNVNKTSEVLNAAAHVLPLAAVMYLLCLGYVLYEKASAKRQLPHVKKLTKGIKAPQSAAVGKFAAVVNNKYFILGIRIAVACLGVAFVIAGCTNGSIQEVFGKAIRICTECIGLG